MEATEGVFAIWFLAECTSEWNPDIRKEQCRQAGPRQSSETSLAHMVEEHEDGQGGQKRRLLREEIKSTARAGAGERRREAIDCWEEETSSSQSDFRAR